MAIAPLVPSTMLSTSRTPPFSAAICFLVSIFHIAGSLGRKSISLNTIKRTCKFTHFCSIFRYFALIIMIVYELTDKHLSWREERSPGQSTIALCGSQEILLGHILLIGGCSFALASLFLRRSLGVPSIVVRYSSAICPLFVRYLFSYELDKYWTSNVHVVDKIDGKSLPTPWVLLG